MAPQIPPTDFWECQEGAVPVYIVLFFYSSVILPVSFLPEVSKTELLLCGAVGANKPVDSSYRHDLHLCLATLAVCYLHPDELAATDLGALSMHQNSQKSP